MHCTLLCIIVTVCISVKIQRTVNKYDMIIALTKVFTIFS